MAVNTIDYKLTLDTSEIPIQMNNIRSQLSGVMAGPSDIAGAQMGFTQFVGAAGAAYGTMRGSLDRTVDPFIISQQPNYGVIQAQSNLFQELKATAFGPQAVANLTPPGVGAGEYTAALQRSLGERAVAAGGGFMRGALPIVGGLGAEAIASRLGGAAMAARFGPLGPIGLAIGAFYVGEKVVESAIERGDKIFAETQQLGEIAAAGRGFGVAETLQFGRGFRDIARRMGISANEMGDIAAGIRGMGMMPRTRDIQESLRQFEGMARDIRELAVGMQTSLGRATQYLREVERMGLGRGVSGVLGAAQTAAGLGTTLGGLLGYVQQGRSVGMQAQVGAGVGGALWLQSAFAGQAGAQDLTPEERLMVGGPLGLGRAFGMQALQTALGPQGQMQLMAMMGPRGAVPLPGTSMGTIEQAAANMFTTGDPIANMVEFTTNRNRMLNQLGAGGLRMMQAQNIQSQAQILMQISPNLTQQRALQFIAMQQGFSEHQARAMAGFILRGFRTRGPAGIGMTAGLPAIYGGPAMAQAEMRIATDRIARQQAAAMEFRGPIDRLSEFWVDFRTSMAQAEEERRVQRLEKQGIVTGTSRFTPAISKSFRTGSGFLAQVPLDVRDFGASSAHTEALLGFGGRQAVSTGKYGPGIIIEGGRVTADAAQEALSSAAHALAYEGRGRWTREERRKIDDYKKNIGMAMDRGEFDRKAFGERVRALRNKVTKGSGEARKELDVEMMRFLKIAEPKLAEEYRERNIGGPQGAIMLRLMRSVGAPMQRYARAIAGGALSGAAGATIRFERFTLLSSVKDIKAFQEFRDDISKHKQGEALPFIQLSPEQKQDYDQVKRVVYSQKFALLRRAIHNARKRHDGNRQAVANDAKVVEAKENLVGYWTRKLTHPLNRKIAQSLAKTAINDESLGKDLLSLTSYVSTTKKKPGAKIDQPQEEGMVRAFQTQGESFQSQVATSLRKTAHTLEEVRKSMTALTAKIKSK